MKSHTTDFFSVPVEIIYSEEMGEAPDFPGAVITIEEVLLKGVDISSVLQHLNRGNISAFDFLINIINS